MSAVIPARVPFINVRTSLELWAASRIFAGRRGEHTAVLSKGRVAQHHCSVIRTLSTCGRDRTERHHSPSTGKPLPMSLPFILLLYKAHIIIPISLVKSHWLRDMSAITTYMGSITHRVCAQHRGQGVCILALAGDQSTVWPWGWGLSLF